MALMWTIFELDNTTVYNCTNAPSVGRPILCELRDIDQNYATSECQSISYLGTLTTAGTILSAVMKPPIAKLSDVMDGQRVSYAITVILYIISYILASSSHAFDQYSASYIIYCLGQTGMQILNQIIVADITSSRTRGLANGLINLPFMIIPWIATFIVDSALSTVGWRWGIGMFGFILPACAAAVIVPLAIFQRRLARITTTTTTNKPKLTLRSLLSHIDFPGTLLLATSFACILLPLSLAGQAPSHWTTPWTTPWIPTLIAVSVLLLLLPLPFYESKFAAHPILPSHFFHIPTTLLTWVVGATDSFAFSVTHTYMYAWSVVVHAFSPRDATFLTFTAGCVQVLSGAVAGFVMWRTRRYKGLLVLRIAVRLVGYGAMLRLRGAENSAVELFAVQVVQGLGSGVVLTVVLVMAQIMVGRAELAQSTSLVLLCVYLGECGGECGGWRDIYGVVEGEN